MRKVFFAAVCFLLLSSLFLSGCRETVSADGVLRNFIGSYPLPDGVIFSSSAREGDAEYADDALLRRLYGEAELPIYSSYAVYLYSDMDTVRECGVFVIREGLGASDDIVLTQDLIYERVHLIALAFPDTQARVMRFGNTVAYALVPDLERAERLLRGLSRGG